jgi:hypothetical protein
MKLEGSMQDFIRNYYSEVPVSIKISEVNYEILTGYIIGQCATWTKSELPRVIKEVESKSIKFNSNVIMEDNTLGDNEYIITNL